MNPAELPKRGRALWLAAGVLAITLVGGWLRLHDLGLPWRPDAALVGLSSEEMAKQIALYREANLQLAEVLDRVQARGGPAAPWKVDLRKCSATLGDTFIIYFNPLPKGDAPAGLSLQDYTYLLGRYSSETDGLFSAAQTGELEHIGKLPNVWAEIRWAARTGGVLHLDDLLLRRVRVGMLLPEGALPQMDRIRTIAQPELGWDDARWNAELAQYKKIYHAYYSPAPTGLEK